MRKATIHAHGRKPAALLPAAALLVAALMVFLTGCGGAKAQSDGIDPETGDLIIDTGALTSTAAFYPIEVDGVDMEVLALVAPDGTVRTAFNTCQVCFSSGRGYYKANGAMLVCQNCGNRFTAGEVGVVSGGCNPLPITAGDRIEQDGRIIVPAALLKRAAVVFENWKK